MQIVLNLLFRNINNWKVNHKTIWQAPFILFSWLFRLHGCRPNFLFQRSVLQTSEFRFCSFSMLWHSVGLPFSALNFANIRNLLLIFRFLTSMTDFEKAISYFSTSNFAFSQTYILRIRALFSLVETSFTSLSFRSFLNNFIFRHMPLQKEITRRSGVF